MIQATSYAVDDNGDLYAWGANALGQIGNNTTGADLDLPVLNGLSDVRAISAGFSHTMAIVGVDRDLVCWGGNEFGQIGNNTTSPSVPNPFTFTGINGFIEISAGGSYSLAVNGNGDVYSFGTNGVGQLGFPFATTLQDDPTVVTNSHCNPLLPCDVGQTYCFNNMVISGLTPVVWNASSNPFFSLGCAPYTVEGTITIMPGAKLTIENILIEFGPNGKIVVERGDGTLAAGILILDGCTLTVHNATSNCMWQGIQVYGYSNQTQFSNDQQGLVHMEYSVIEYAHVGIYAGKRFLTECVNNQFAYCGGIIEANGGNTFADNNISIEFPLGYSTTMYSASFVFGVNIASSGTNFICTDIMRDPRYLGERAECFIRAINLKGLSIANAATPNTLNFINTPTNAINNTVGIQLLNNCTDFKIQDGYFNDVDRAIEIANPANSFDNHGIYNVHIENSNIGIHILHSKSNFLGDLNPTGLTNSIDNGVGNNNIAILNEYSIGTRIYQTQIDNCNIGINLINSGNNGSFPVYIKRNTITNTGISLNSGGNNRRTEWHCNNLSGYSTGFQLYDFINASRVQPQGRCGNNALLDFPAGNQFQDLSSAVDISDNSSLGTFTLSYFYNIANISTVYEPDIFTTNVTVTGCATFGMIDEVANCTALSYAQRNIAEILAERDTILDTLDIGRTNIEAVSYYLSNQLTDSVIWYIETYASGEYNDLLISLYLELGMLEEADDLIKNLPTDTEDEEDIFELYNLLYTLAFEDRTIYELTDAEYELISSLSIKYTEAGRGALVIMNIIAGKPIDITCEMTGSCEEERWANQNIQAVSKPSLSEKFALTNRPNPFCVETTISIPETFKNDITIFEIFDTNGKLIQSKSISKNESELIIKADDLNNGIYFYRFKSKMNISPKGKMIVIK